MSEIPLDTAMNTNLHQDGVCVLPDFIHQPVIHSLLSEYSALFDNSNSLVDRGFSLIKYNIRNDCRVLRHPELWISSVNLLEFAIDIGKILNHEYYQKLDLEFRCTGIECRQEVGDSLDIHSDNVQHRFRVYIYLTDAINGKSGELQYVPKSQFTDWRNTTSLNKFSSALHTCYTKAGGLVIININGLHASTLRTTNRKVIVFSMMVLHHLCTPTSTVIVPASNYLQKSSKILISFNVLTLKSDWEQWQISISPNLLISTQNAKLVCAC